MQRENSYKNKVSQSAIYQFQRVNSQPNPFQEQIQFIPKTYKINYIYKIIVALIFVIGYTFYRIFYVKFDNSLCIIDTYFQATFNANRGLANGAANAVIGIGQVIMDSSIIFMGIAWLILIKNMRFPISAAIIYLFRAFFLNIQKLPFDDYIVWYNPGFFSFTVPYDRTRDFFYSGHTSALLIIVMECFLLEWFWVSLIFFLCLIYMMNMLIISRIHYTIDIMAAIIFTIVIYRLTILILKYIDYVFSIPFYIGRFIFFKFKNKEQIIQKQQEQQQNLGSIQTQNIIMRRQIEQIF